MTDSFNHFDEKGRARMVDVSGKEPTLREAIAEAIVRLGTDLLREVLDAGIAKGDVFVVARLAGIAAVKRTSELIPLAHPLAIHHAAIDFAPSEDGASLRITLSDDDLTFSQLVEVSLTCFRVRDGRSHLTDQFCFTKELIAIRDDRRASVCVGIIKEPGLNASSRFDDDFGSELLESSQRARHDRDASFARKCLLRHTNLHGGTSFFRWFASCGL